jgi:hypothetical protein
MPRLSDAARVLLVPDPPGGSPRLAECRLVYLDEATGRLIVTSADANEPLAAVIEAPLLILVVRPGEGVFARPCLVEASLVAAGWLILYPTAPWRRIERRLAERAVVMLPAEGYRYMTSGGGLAVRGVVRNLSTTGFLFDTDARVGLGELVVLNITLSDAEVIRIRGQSVRIASPAPNTGGSLERGLPVLGRSPG